MATEVPKNIAMDDSKAKNVVFVFIPGAFHLTDYLQPMRDYLSEMGYESVAVSHQTLDPINPGNSVFDDAAKVEKVVKDLLETGKDIIVVMHSYGGSVGSQAIGHLLSTFDPTSSHDNDDKACQMGKIMRLVYVAAIIPQAHETAADVSKLISADNNNNNDGEGIPALPLEIVADKMFCKEDIKEVFLRLGDLPASERDKYYALLQGWPVQGTPDALTHFGWRSVPSTYICAVNDRAISAKAQTRMWTRVKRWMARDANITFNRYMLDRLNAGPGNVQGQEPCTASAEGESGQRMPLIPDPISVKEIHSDHCSMFILRKHVDVLGSMLTEMVVSEEAAEGQARVIDQGVLEAMGR